MLTHGVYVRVSVIFPLGTRFYYSFHFFYVCSKSDFFRTTWLICIIFANVTNAIPFFFISLKFVDVNIATEFVLNHSGNAGREKEKDFKIKKYCETNAYDCTSYSAHIL